MLVLCSILHTCQSSLKLPRLQRYHASEILLTQQNTHAENTTRFHCRSWHGKCSEVQQILPRARLQGAATWRIWPHDARAIARLYMTTAFSVSRDITNYTRVIDPLTAALKPHSNGPLYTAIRWLVHWPLMGVLLHLVQRRGAWAGCGPAQSLLAVPNVTAHPSTASIPTSYHSMHHYYLCPLKG